MIYKCIARRSGFLLVQHVQELMRENNGERVVEPRRDSTIEESQLCCDPNLDIATRHFYQDTTMVLMS